MMMKQDSISPIPIPSVCSHCSTEERRLLHHVRHQGMLRRLCTSCVLLFHSQSFCPTCFLVYDRPPPASNDFVTCSKCYSCSHSHCVGAKASNLYVCPLCVNPKVPIFKMKKVMKDGDGEGKDGSFREVDKQAAKVLLAAAKIANSTMIKAAATARVEAERRAKEAASTRKRAREALEHVAFLVAKEKLKRKDLLVAEVSGSGNAVSRDKNHKFGSANSAGVGNPAASMEQSRICGQRQVDGMEGANEVSARLNAVGLREKERLQGFGPQNMAMALPNNAAPMVVGDNERIRMNPASNINGSYSHDRSIGSEKEKPSNLVHVENRNGMGDKVNKGQFSVPPVGDQLQHLRNNHERDDNIGSQP